jgi:hypothetical protein
MPEQPFLIPVELLRQSAATSTNGRHHTVADRHAHREPRWTAFGPSPRPPTAQASPEPAFLRDAARFKPGNKALRRT